VTAGSKILERAELARRIVDWKAAGETVALANGLFDLLHVGHLRYLEDAAREADHLVVAVNADASARALKGPDRPIVPEAERAELIAGFTCVDAVLVFGETTVEPLAGRAAPRRALQRHRLHRRHRARTRGREGTRYPRRHHGDPKHHATRDLIAQIRGLRS
jgi:rfaE bifunctional protein nucleotidyltransferase chain/domain